MDSNGSKFKNGEAHAVLTEISGDSSFQFLSRSKLLPMQISFSPDSAFPEDHPDLMLQDSILGDARRIISLLLGVSGVCGGDYKQTFSGHEKPQHQATNEIPIRVG